ncbi:acetylornithine and succinylornithine aminotransferase [Trametes elegans]|nr:acetylornithine and succinylornithine aminotransferase [Trametes elegans]
MRAVARQAQRTLVRPARQGLSARYMGTETSSRSGLPLPSAPSKRYTAVTHPEDPASITPAVQELLDRSHAYILPVYARPPIVMSKGKGAYIWDVQGRQYLDFSAGIAVNALGHGDEGVVEVMRTTASTLLHTSNVYHHEHAGKLAELLITLTQSEGGLGWAPGSTPSVTNGTSGAKVFFANSGTEANEGALKVARKIGKERWAQATGKPWDDPSCDKYEIVCFERGFHGRSMGALSVTSNAKYQKPFLPLIPGVKVGQLNDAGALGGLVGDKTCAVIVEPIQGEGGINVADVEWLRALRKRCDEVGAVLIYDEIQCGLYRTGNLWAHSSVPADAHPDIVTTAKPLANGYPIGAVLLRDNIAEVMTAGTHGTTFGGSPLACALGYHVLSRLSDKTFVASIKETSDYLEERLTLLTKWFPNILQEQVRGRGLIRGLGFKNSSHPGRVVELARERGVLLLTAGQDAVRLVPSLNIGAGEVGHAMDVVESCLSIVSSE